MGRNKEINDNFSFIFLFSSSIPSASSPATTLRRIHRLLECGRLALVHYQDIQLETALNAHSGLDYDGWQRLQQYYVA